MSASRGSPRTLEVLLRDRVSLLGRSAVPPYGFIEIRPRAAVRLSMLRCVSGLFLSNSPIFTGFSLLLLWRKGSYRVHCELLGSAGRKCAVSLLSALLTDESWATARVGGAGHLVVVLGVLLP